MATEPRAFQRATIEAALQSFKATKGSRRFLVADEVGLGKTIVAQGIVARMAAKRQSPLRVFYVCSNLVIAKQNLKKLVSFLPESERKSAIAEVDRPSLMATREPPRHPLVQVYSLTPEVALSRGGGRVQERALVFVLVERLLPSTVSGLYRALRMGVKPENFDYWIKTYKRALENGALADSQIQHTFRTAFRSALGLSPAQQLPAKLKEKIGAGTSLEIIQAARNALAVAALEKLSPDLVIFDEFQRFRDLMVDEPGNGSEGAAIPAASDLSSSDEAAARVLRAIRGDGDLKKPALLLLSATPYVPFRSRSEAGGENNGAADFFELVRFLCGTTPTGKSNAATVAAHFSALSEQFRKGEPLGTAAATLRRELRALLLPLMSRMERPRVSDASSRESAETQVINSHLLPNDVALFMHLVESFRREDRDWALPLWQSVPLPMQSLGSRYQAWKNAKPSKQAPALSLQISDRNNLALQKYWPHPRLRALLEVQPLQQLSLPWVAPSLPWWPLEGPWARLKQPGEVDGKLLIFSRFRAVPVALAGLLSYSLESKLFGYRGKASEPEYDGMTKRFLLAADPKRPGLLELFHPSPILTGLDPLAASGRDLRATRVAVQKQLRQRLADIGVKVVATIDRPRQRPWEILAALEGKTGQWQGSCAAWSGVIDQIQLELGHEAGTRLREMLERWTERAKQDLTEIDDDGEFKPLVDLAIDGPAIVLARSLQRHWPEALDSTNLGKVVGLSWRGLRSYLDAPWFAAALSSTHGDNFPAAIRLAVLQGNLEAVLDEHFWYLAAAGNESWPERLQELEKSFRLRTSNIVMHENGPESAAFRLRCHTAVPLTDARTDTGRIPQPGSARSDQDTSSALASQPMMRPEEVRRAFNTPFWPHVLVTTSIGQEGLDFHPWCRALAHWDLCSGPVDLEQREGRVNRFAGLAIRRAIATRLKDSVKSQLDHKSPWIGLAALAERDLSDDTGLQPWWVAPNADVQRLVFAIPGSDQKSRLDTLNRERALYRLVLGMPN